MLMHELWIHRRSLILLLAGAIAAYLAGQADAGSVEEFLLRQISPMCFGAAMVGFQFEMYRADHEHRLVDLYRRLNALFDRQEVYQEEVEQLLNEVIEEADLKIESSPLPRES